MSDPLGLSLSFVVSDPWELTREPGSAPRHAYVVAASADANGRERVLLKLDEPIEWQASSFQFLVAQRRGGAHLIDDLMLGVSVPCSFVGQPDDRAHGVDPLDTSWWRGGLSGLANLGSTA